MSEKINIDEFDLMMKSILDEAREDVPERVWEGVSSGLAMAERKKTVVLWWRRAAIGIAAAAAVVLGVFLSYNIEDDIVRPSNDSSLIAVAKPDHEAVLMPVLMADIIDRPVAPVKLFPPTKSSAPEEEVAMNEMPEEKIDNNVREEKNDIVKKDDKSEEQFSGYFPEEWEEDTEKQKIISLVLSGLTGTNDAMRQNRTGMMMRPSVTPAPTRSGIEETSTKSSYGVPLSFGVGVKIDLNKRWSIGAGLNYTFLTRQFYGKYTQVGQEGDILMVRLDDIRNQQHYIGIPVNAFYSIINNDKINFYTYAGGTVEKCVSDSYRLLNSSITHSENIKGVQFSVNAGIGVEFMLGKHLGLYIDPSLRYYFKNGNQPKSIRTVQPLMLGFEMGFRAKL